jgi:hypothetical protein
MAKINGSGSRVLIWYSKSWKFFNSLHSFDFKDSEGFSLNRRYRHKHLVDAVYDVFKGPLGSFK